jgi:acyl transferase domain-containing protein
MVIKTGCSASMVAVHEACRALQAGDVDAAVVGGANVILGPSTYTMMSSEGLISPEGSSKPFDASADGYGRAEAINAIFLKRFDDAVRDGNPIRGVIRGSGTSANGRGVDGLLSPDISAQAALIRSVYRSAGLDPSETAYIEVLPVISLFAFCICGDTLTAAPYRVVHSATVLAPKRVTAKRHWPLPTFLGVAGSTWVR